ncbi:hypothetical protein IFM89_030472 [Coptis chinensis]|uniref:Peptidase A1 domain-containing protein n=1 Tax=Coptis chinensis TaxID=261450 RepID=A0A835HCH2_9MAGN|nr:hypothetical protein IFM89_030472 [Coptis chinensis]
MNSLSQNLLSSFLSLLILDLAFAGPDGLTIKLIHRDSIESPLYPGNLTMEQRVVRLNQQSKTRMEQMALVAAVTRAAATNQTLHTNVKHVPVTLEGSFYLASVGIGPTKVAPDAHYESYYFLVDTGSSLTWTQCEGCNPCFYQKQPLFAFLRSTTFRELLCDNEGRCDVGNCEDNLCTYNMAYGNGAVTEGLIASEQFTFNSDSGGRTETVDNLLFGCGFKQSNFDFHQPVPMQNEIAGIIGLGR